MVYTVTCNPSLDYIVDVPDFTLGIVNRTVGERILPGGKGLNVSMVLHNLGVESTAFGFTAGFTGEELKRLMAEKGIATDFIEVKDGFNRINVKIRGREESEINGQGPDITQENINELFRKLDKLTADDVLVLAGSIPDRLPQSLYMDIMKHLADKHLKVVVDATKDLLVNVLPYHPFLVKPNNHELGEIFGVTISTKEDAIAYAKQLHARGAQNVLVSMAGEGAVLVAEDGTVYCGDAPKGKVVNSVGAGDSMVAGFLYGALVRHCYGKAFRWGVCTGSASAFSEELATQPEVEALLKFYEGIAA